MKMDSYLEHRHDRTNVVSLPNAGSTRHTKRQRELKEKCTKEEFISTGTLASEMQELCSIRRAFPRPKRILFPTKRLDVLPTPALHTNLNVREGFPRHGPHWRFTCNHTLRTMNGPLGIAYSNPIDIGINTVTRNWAKFIKIQELGLGPTNLVITS